MNNQHVFEIARGIAFLFILSGLGVGFFFGFRKLAYEQQVVLALLAVVLFVEVFSLLQWSTKTNNNYIYHFYSIVEFLLLGSLYERNLEGLVKRIYIRGILLGFVVFATINTLFFQDLSKFNSNVTFVECLVLIVLSILYFFKLLRDLDHRNLERVPMFWISMSILTYFSGALILFHVVNDLIPLSLKERGAIWGTHALFNIIHYFLFAVAVWVRPEKYRH